MYKKKVVQSCCVVALAIAPLGFLHAKPTGSLQTGSGAYTFNPMACAIYKDGDVYDIEVHGPGTDSAGEKVYINFSSTADAMEVMFGVDSVFASADKLMRSVGPLQIQVDGSKIKATEIKLADQDQQVVETDATLEIDCSRG